MKILKIDQNMRFYMIRILVLCVFIISYCPLTHCQLHVTDQAEIFVDANGMITVDGNLEIESGGTLTMNGQEIMIAGDLVQNGIFMNSGGELAFIGSGVQNVSGDLTGANSTFDLVINQGNNMSSVDFSNDIEVENTLEFLFGKIKTLNNEIYIKNEAENAIVGHFLPNVSDGTYASNDRYVEGILSRDVNPEVSTTYIFPVGSSDNFYNPIQVENLNGSVGKISANFTSDNLGAINFQGIIDCMTNNPAYSGSASNVVQSNNADTDIEYTAMTGQGVWNLNSASEYDYDLVAYPNSSNANVNPSTADQYRLLKRPSGDDPSIDWSPFALSGNPCISTSNYFELVGTNFTGFSIFGAVGVESAILPVELIDFYAQAIDNDFIKLRWTTASEINNLGFVIEKSLDGKEFEQIGWLDGISDFEIERNYFFDDKNVIKDELYYYRLKQMDLDGQFEYSDVVSAKVLSDFQIDISPNPTNDQINIQVSNELDNQLLSFEIFDVLGRQVFYQKDFFKGGNSYHFSFQNFNCPKGVYFLKIRSVHRQVITERLIYR